MIINYQQVDSCPFCKIARKELKSHIVYEDDYVIAFLDSSPTSKGHTLVVTKEHFTNMAMCPKDLLDRAIEAAQKVAQAQIANLGATGVNIQINIGKSAGQSVPHFHIHVIPRYENDGLLLTFPHKDVPEAEMKSIAKTIYVDSKGKAKSVNDKKVIDAKLSDK